MGGVKSIFNFSKAKRISKGIEGYSDAHLPHAIKLFHCHQGQLGTKAADEGGIVSFTKSNGATTIVHCDEFNAHGCTQSVGITINFSTIKQLPPT